MRSQFVRPLPEQVRLFNIDANATPRSGSLAMTEIGVVARCLGLIADLGRLTEPERELAARTVGMALGRSEIDAIRDEILAGTDPLGAA